MLMQVLLAYMSAEENRDNVNELLLELRNDAAEEQGSQGLLRSVRFSHSSRLCWNFATWPLCCGVQWHTWAVIESMQVLRPAGIVTTTTYAQYRLLLSYIHDTDRPNFTPPSPRPSHAYWMCGLSWKDSVLLTAGSKLQENPVCS